VIRTPDTGSFKAAARTSGRSLTQWPLLIVLGVVAAGLGLVIAQHWRMGTAVIGGGLCIAAMERALLPGRVAGLLQVRSRVFDVSFLLVIGAAVILLAFIVPAP
jgi:hypothetical protein